MCGSICKDGGQVTAGWLWTVITCKHTDRLFGTRSVMNMSIALQRTYADEK
jgi:hypothetical protein